MTRKPRQLELFPTRYGRAGRRFPRDAGGPRPAPYVARSETSKAAGEKIKDPARTLRQRVLAFLQQCGTAGATDEEICEALNLASDTSRPRRVELVRGGLAVDSGERRRTRSGRMAVVWVLQRPL